MISKNNPNNMRMIQISTIFKKKNKKKQEEEEEEEEEEYDVDEGKEVKDLTGKGMEGVLSKKLM